MDCENYQRKYLDHDWTRQSLTDAVLVAEHLRNCAACRNTADEYDHLRHVLGSAESAGDLRLARRSKNTLTRARPISGGFAVTAAIAPAVLAGIVGWMIYHQSQHGAPITQPPGLEVARDPSTIHQSPSTATWTAEDIHHGVQVFQEVSATFDGRTNWVALGDRSADVGLDSSGVDSVGLDSNNVQNNIASFVNVPKSSSKAPGDNASPSTIHHPPSINAPRVFLLRLAFFRGKDEKSRTDLVIVAGQNARMELPLEPGRILHYVIGTTVGAPPKLSLWTEVCSPHGGETVAVLATQMQPRSGETLNAGRIATSSGEYSLEVSFVEEVLPGVTGPEKLKSCG